MHARFNLRILNTIAWIIFLCLFQLTGSALMAQETGAIKGKVTEAGTGNPVAFATVIVMQNGVTKAGANTDEKGVYKISLLAPGAYDVEARWAGNNTKVTGVIVRAGAITIADITPETEVDLQSVVITEGRHQRDLSNAKRSAANKRSKAFKQPNGNYEQLSKGNQPDPVDREGYDHISENRFFEALVTPQSTFAIDVDAASYSNTRRMLLGENRMPPAGAVRIEELVNYFDYDYPQPQGEHPFSITAEVGACPWADGHQLVHIGLQGQNIAATDLPPSNLVFLIDVSGSMDSYDKLPLLQKAMSLLANGMRPQDHVAIVTYAGAPGLVLPSTPGNQKTKIIEALEHLEAGGSTAGGAGIQLAYNVAAEHFLQNGNNRVILCTDGDFNVGMSSDDEMVSLIEKKRETGISLSVLGFGTGNLQDAKMEKLADHGNGNYAYIDQLLEAQKVLVKEIGGTLTTIAKDVKIQVEFNPAKVKSYRLIGYENRHLENEDFDDDKKDAGELGAGHSVTAIYEIVPVDSMQSKPPKGNKLRYQTATLNENAASGELLTVKFRYKEPTRTESKLIEQPLLQVDLSNVVNSENFRFSAAVAAFGMLLRDSQFKGNASYAMVESLARGALGKDPDGYRAEFLKMVKTANLLVAGAKKAENEED